MRCILLSVFLLQFSSIQAHAQAGSTGGNGGGLAEMRLATAVEQIYKLMQYCANEGRCKLTQEELNLTNSILRLRSSELAADKRLEYRSGAKEKGFFFIDDQERVAKTGLAPGAVIYINRDLIYKKNAIGEMESISYPEAIQIIAHELGHHARYKDHNFLDTFGSKYAILAKRFAYSLPLGFGADFVRALVMNSRDSSGQTELRDNIEPTLGTLMIEDGVNAYDVSQIVLGPILKKEVEIAFIGKDKPAPPGTKLGEKDIIQSLQFYNLHWDPEGLNGIFVDERVTTLRLYGQVAVFGWNGRDRSLKLITGVVDFVLTFKVKGDGVNSVAIVKGSERLKSMKSQIYRCSFYRDGGDSDSAGGSN